MIPAEYHAQLKPFRESVPVNVQAAVESFGLKVFSAELPEQVSGILLKNEDHGTKSGYIILVDETETSQRQRFTAAHELGHYLLHRDAVGDRIEENFFLHAEGMTSTQETEAHEFARELLMPMDKIVEAIRNGTNTVEKLADLFDVSVVAMGNRLDIPA